MTDLVLCGLAAHRFWVLWFAPADMRTPLTITREWLAKRHRLIAKGATCTICMTLWVALGIDAALIYVKFIVWVLAISELIGWFDAGLRRLER